MSNPTQARQQLMDDFRIGVVTLLDDFLNRMRAIRHSGWPIVDLWKFQDGESRPDGDVPSIHYYLPTSERGWMLDAPQVPHHDDVLPTRSGVSQFVVTSLPRITQFDWRLPIGSLIWHNNEWQLLGITPILASVAQREIFLGPRPLEIIGKNQAECQRSRDRRDRELFREWFALVEKSGDVKTITDPLSRRLLDAAEAYQDGHAPRPG